MADDHDIFARIPVEFRNGAWVNENGRRLVAAPGTKAEFWIKQQALPDLWPHVDVATSASGQFLDKGSCLRFALSVRHKNQLTEELASHLILPHDMWHKVEWGPVKGWYSTDAHFIQVELGEPSDAQRAEFPSFTGGLLIKVRGHNITEIEPSSFDLPKGIEARKPQSLNHAYTILSEVYELHRASHTGSVYQRVFYEGNGGIWYPLELLRKIGIAQANGDKPHEESLANSFWASKKWIKDG